MTGQHIFGVREIQVRVKVQEAVDLRVGHTTINLEGGIFFYVYFFSREVLYRERYLYETSTSTGTNTSEKSLAKNACTSTSKKSLAKMLALALALYE